MPSSKDAYAEEDTPPTNVTQNAAKQKVGDNHSIGEANESTHKSHTAQLTLLHHVAGLADACIAKKTDSSPALVKAACSLSKQGGVLTTKKWLMRAQGYA